VRALLESGVDINQLSADKTALLMMAIINASLPPRHQLHKPAANPKLATFVGGTALHRVVDQRL